MDERSTVQVMQSNGNMKVIRQQERRMLSERLAHAKLKYAQAELAATTYRPHMGTVDSVVALERFPLDLELDIASEVIAVLEDKIMEHDEETRAQYAEKLT